MPTTCWAPGCTSGYRTSTDTSRHFFRVPANKCDEWKRKIPRVGQLTYKHYICDLHFEDHFIKKQDEFVIGGKTVFLPKDRWHLTENAIPTLFPNLPHYLSNRVLPRRTLKRNSSSDGVVKKKKCIPMEHATLPSQEQQESASIGLPLTSHVDSDHRYASQLDSTHATGTSRFKTSHCLQQTLKRQAARIRRLNATLQRFSREIKALRKRLDKYDRMPEKMKMIVSQSSQNCSATAKSGNRFSDEWIIDALLIRCKSTSTYRLLREGGYLPLPSMSTLNRSLGSLKPEFGFDPQLFESLAKKLSCVDVKERRGVLMFDEVTISKNVEFRVDTCKIVGMVDFGSLTTPDHQSTEGDHALVFLFQPHLSGWVQTVGCFCSSGTTPALVLSQLLLKCIVLLENSGAIVDGLVCDGASTNRSALATFGFNGSLHNLQNKMVNPCDVNRKVFFFSDMPHLLKTIRNNLLRRKTFQVCFTGSWTSLWSCVKSKVAKICFFLCEDFKVKGPSFVHFIIDLGILT
jgi:hypothetical protein